jgi:uncharacterized membrane protein
MYKSKRLKILASFFIIGFVGSLGLNLFWLYKSYNPDPVIVALLYATPLGEIIYNVFFSLILVVSYIFTVRRGWLLHTLPRPIIRVVSAIALLILGWNIYAHLNYWLVLISGSLSFSSVVVSAIYALLIALALLVFTGRWSHQAAAALVIVLVLSQLVVDSFIDFFLYLYAFSGLSFPRLYCQLIYVSGFSVAVALQTMLCGYWISLGNDDREAKEIVDGENR